LILAKTNCTPVDFWLRLPLRELRPWIRAHNEVAKEEQEQSHKWIRKQRKKRR